jgi:hypothetical protein
MQRGFRIVQMKDNPFSQREIIAKEFLEIFFRRISSKLGTNPS